MADFEAPAGPPPPKAPEVPPGWLAKWNEQYKEWFYVNTYTKKSQWEKPNAPAVPPAPVDEDAPPEGPPPAYIPNPGAASTPAMDVKKNPYNDPANSTLGSPVPGSSSSTAAAAGPPTATAAPPAINNDSKPGAAAAAAVMEDEDAKLAAKLQAEEDAHARGSPHQQYGGPSPPQQFPAQLPPRSGGSNADKAKGLLGKLFGSKNKHSAGQSGGFPGAGGYSQQQPMYPPPQQPMHGQPQPPYGGYPPQPGYGAPGYGPGYAPPPQGYYGGHPPQQGMYGPHGAQQSGKTGRPGMGMMMGGAALGVGAGLLGGALVADAIHDGQQDAYAQGYQDSAGGDDFGGGDFDF